MKALILAGGEGTRLRPLTTTLPKSLLPICNRPFLEHQIRLLARHAVREATLLTGYLHEDFPGFARRMTREIGVRLEISREEQPLGTAGAVRNVLDRLDEAVLVFNGDVITDLDLTRLVDFHRRRGAVVTLALTPVADAGPYGLVPVDPDGCVREFLEKPPPEVARNGGLINAGTYVLEPEALREVPAGVMWSFERQVFPGLLAAGRPLYGFASDAYWLDIGTPVRYLQAHRDALDGKADIQMEGKLVRAGAAQALVSASAEVRDGAMLGPHATLGPGVIVERGARVEDSVALSGARVGEGATVRGSILGPGSSVAAGRLVEDAILAEGEAV